MQIIVIHGKPGVGKTTLARQLAEHSLLPAISKDTLKELFFDHYGVGDRLYSQHTGAAAIEALYGLAEAHLTKDSVILESAFFVDYSRPRLADLARKYQAQLVEVYCTVPEAIREERFTKRFQSGERHPGHVDDKVERLPEAVFDSRYEPLKIGELITVDTSGPVDVKKLWAKITSLA